MRWGHVGIDGVIVIDRGRGEGGREGEQAEVGGCILSLVRVDNCHLWV